MIDNSDQLIIATPVRTTEQPRSAAETTFRAPQNQLLNRYLDQVDRAPNTLTLYADYVRDHISPFLGHLNVGQLSPRDSFRPMNRIWGALNLDPC
jgi:hypothetical protein